MKTVLGAALLLVLSGLRQGALALTADVDRYDDQQYAQVSATANVVYLHECARKKLQSYHWKIWVGNYGLKSFVQPVATITVKREPEEAIQTPTQLYLQKALEASAGIGGNILCFITLNQNPYVPGADSIIFRSYKQIFLSSHDGLVDYYNERVMEGHPLTRDDLKEAGKKSETGR
ncbi:MAG: hypothetical protein A2902_04800 [Elusimicrobia bacterium RIFCSPLOWO2_01_FULL_64_13]|nr:MAG: hypothetical protein A2636_06590 [Elusimicrobia bacterium RIFCSPHIGHO2_01_FULL_64_10]OGR95248.1 MAG: hypothetical protein A2902_04800 [Elusimicrobia bacterium RIFCSPLOWO2_01_FULL_64_13]